MYSKVAKRQPKHRIGSRKMEKYFIGHSPIKQAVRIIKFLIDQPIIKAAKKTLKRFSIMYGSAKQIAQHTDIITIINPGFPKFVLGACIPVTTISFDSIYTHGKKQMPIKARQMKNPISCAYFIKQKKGLKYQSFLRGPDQIRTGVEAFAELCLATRPQDHFFKEQQS